MTRENIEYWIWVFCIIIILALCVKIDNSWDKYDCEKCSVTLFNEIPYSGQLYKFGTYNIGVLFNNYSKDGYCLIKWDPTQGYIINGA